MTAARLCIVKGMRWLAKGCAAGYAINLGRVASKINQGADRQRKHPVLAPTLIGAIRRAFLVLSHNPPVGRKIKQSAENEKG